MIKDRNVSEKLLERNHGKEKGNNQNFRKNIHLENKKRIAIYFNLERTRSQS